MKLQKLIKTISFGFIVLSLASAGAVQKTLNKRVAPLAKSVLIEPTQLQLPSMNNRREMVQFSRAIDLTGVVNQKEKPVKSISQEYWFHVSGSQLKKGIEVHTSGVEALIRISPNAVPVRSSDNTQLSKSKPQAAAIELEQLEIIAPDGRILSGKNAMSFSINAKQLSTTAFSKGSTGFKLDKVLSFGRFQLKSNQSIEDKQQYTIYVLDKDSPFKLSLQLASQQILTGGRLSAKIDMIRAGKKSRLNLVTAKFVAPDGQVYPVKTRANRTGGFELDQVLALPFSRSAGLWEMQVISQSKQGNLVINRNSKLAFAYQPRTANVDQKTSRIVTSKRGLSVTIDVNASHPGRYEVTGILYVVNRNGSKLAIAEARTAQWIEPGNAALPLLFKGKLLPQLKKEQHFEVAKIGLNDQSRMSVLR